MNISPEERCAFRQLLEIQDTFEVAAERVWTTDFRPDRVPMVFVRRAPNRRRAQDRPGLIATAIHLPEVAELTSAPALALPIGLESPFLRFDPEGLLPVDELLEPVTAGEPVRLGLSIGGRDCLVFSIDDPSIPVQSHEFARFLVHEAFHFHQLFEAQWRLPVGHDPNVPYIADATDALLAREESAAIEATAYEPNLRIAIAGARQFLAMRRRRHERRPDLALLEPGNEQIEGTARFVENQYAWLNGRPRRLPASSPEAWTPDHLQFGRHYRTGARACELLDRMDAPHWRERLSSGCDPIGLLAQALVDDHAVVDQTVDVRAPQPVPVLRAVA